MAPDLAFLRRHPRVRRLLVPALGVLAFGLFLVLTFPYDVLARRIEVEAKSAGADLTIGSMGGTGLVGVRARDVRLRISPSPGAEPTPELRFERADVRPDLLSLILRRTSFGFSLAGYGGTARGHMALSNDPRNPGVSSFRIDARDVDVSRLPLRDWGGLAAVGKLQLNADLPTLLPAANANGSLSLSLEGGAVTGGTVMGFALPRTSLGHVEGAVAVEKGTAKVDEGRQLLELQFTIIGQDLYLRPPTGPVQKLPLSFAGSVYDPSIILNPDRGIAAALASGKDATTQEREQVDGVDTYRVQTTFPAQPLGTMVPGLATDKPSDIWVAVQGSRLIKAQFPTTSGGITAHFSDYDAPAQITAPV